MGTDTEAEPARRELVEHLTGYLDGAPSPAELARFGARLEEREGCRNHLGRIRHRIELVGVPSVASLSTPAREELPAAFPRSREPGASGAPGTARGRGCS